MREIQLTQGLVALVDDCDFERLNQVKWCAARNCNTFYAVRHSLRVNGKRHRILMHHEVIGTPPTGLIADHRNGQGIDNRHKNLRFVTNRQNGQNRKNEKTSSKHPGVSWSKTSKKWRAYIQIRRKSKHLGYFTDEKDAFEAYKQAVYDLGEKMIERI